MSILLDTSIKSSYFFLILCLVALANTSKPQLYHYVKDKTTNKIFRPNRIVISCHHHIAGRGNCLTVALDLFPPTFSCKAKEYLFEQTMRPQSLVLKRQEYENSLNELQSFKIFT